MTKYFPYKEHLISKINPDYGEEYKKFEELLEMKLYSSDLAEENDLTKAISMQNRADYQYFCIKNGIKYDNFPDFLTAAELIYTIATTYTSFAKVKEFYSTTNRKERLIHDIFFLIARKLEENGGIRQSFNEKYVNKTVERYIFDEYSEKVKELKKKKCVDHLGNVYPSFYAMCKEYGISDKVVSDRIYRFSWPLEKALTTEVMKNGEKSAK